MKFLSLCIEEKEFIFKSIGAKKKAIKSILFDYENYNLGFNFKLTVINDESGLTWEERKAYNRLKDKAQPRIAKLKEQGLYP